jgi:hypothetical protein
VHVCAEFATSALLLNPAPPVNSFILLQVPVVSGLPEVIGMSLVA